MRVWRMRPGISIALKSASRRRLEALSRDCNAPHKHVWRAEIVLLSADGAGTNEIMRRTGKSKTCVWRWQERFMQEGYDGLLRDKTRPSRIPPLGADTVERVVALILPMGSMGQLANIDDLDSYRAGLRRGKALGFTTASCIHPAHVPIINEEYGASATELDRARRLLAAFDAAVADGAGAAAFEGSMIDLPVVIRARRLLERAASWAGAGIDRDDRVSN